MGRLGKWDAVEKKTQGRPQYVTIDRAPPTALTREQKGPGNAMAGLDDQ